MDPNVARDLALYFASISPRPANDGNAALSEQGKSIYQLGMPEANIVACVVCHGPSAEGVGEIPRLGGLAYTYLKRRLEKWGEGFHKPPMASIAGKLSDGQVDALASYLSFIP
jgi:cytochrome c553